MRPSCSPFFSPGLHIDGIGADPSEKLSRFGTPQLPLFLVTGPDPSRSGWIRWGSIAAKLKSMGWEGDEMTVRFRIAATSSNYASDPVTKAFHEVGGAEASVDDEGKSIIIDGIRGGSDDGVRITVPSEYGDYDVTIPKNIIDELVSSGLDLTIEREGGMTVTYDSDSVSGMSEHIDDSETGSITFEASRNEETLTISVTVTVYDATGSVSIQRRSMTSEAPLRCPSSTASMGPA